MCGRRQIDTDMAALEEVKKELREKIDKAEKESAQVQRAVEDLSKERNILRSTLLKASDRTQHVETLIRVQQGGQRTLENEILGVRKEIKIYREKIEDLLEERERMEQEVTGATQKYFTVLEQARCPKCRTVARTLASCPYHCITVLVLSTLVGFLWLGPIRSNCKTCRWRHCSARLMKLRQS